MVIHLLDGTAALGLAFVILAWSSVRVRSNRVSSFLFWLASMVCAAIIIGSGADWLGLLVVVLSSLQVLMVRIGAISIPESGELPSSEQGSKHFGAAAITLGVCIGVSLLFVLAMKRIPPWTSFQSSTPLRLADFVDFVSGSGNWALILITTLLSTCILAGGFTFAGSRKK